MPGCHQPDMESNVWYVYTSSSHYQIQVLQEKQEKQEKQAGKGGTSQQQQQQSCVPKVRDSFCFVLFCFFSEPFPYFPLQNTLWFSEFFRPQSSLSWPFISQVLSADANSLLCCLLFQCECRHDQYLRGLPASVVALPQPNGSFERRGCRHVDARSSRL